MKKLSRSGCLYSPGIREEVFSDSHIHTSAYSELLELPPQASPEERAAFEGSVSADSVNCVTFPAALDPLDEASQESGRIDEAQSALDMVKVTGAIKESLRRHEHKIEELLAEHRLTKQKLAEVEEELARARESLAEGAR